MKFNSLRLGQRFRAYGLAGVWIKTAAEKARPERSGGQCFSIAPRILVKAV